VGKGRGGRGGRGSEAGFAPSSSPCEEKRLHARQGGIDTQGTGGSRFFFA